LSKRHRNRARALFEPLLADQRILRGIIDRQLGQWLGVRLLDLGDPNAVFRPPTVSSMRTLRPFTAKIGAQIPFGAPVKSMSRRGFSRRRVLLAEIIRKTRH
jgi:hypothetical protein